MEKKVSRRDFLKGFVASVIAAPIVAITPAPTKPKPTIVANVKTPAPASFGFDKPKPVMKAKPSDWEWFTVAEVQEMERVYPSMLVAGMKWEETFARYMGEEKS